MPPFGADFAGIGDGVGDEGEDFSGFEVQFPGIDNVSGLATENVGVRVAAEGRVVVGADRVEEVPIELDAGGGGGGKVGGNV